MQPSDTEILVQIHKVQSDLFVSLPSDIRMETEDVTAAQIRIRLLRARLELSPQQEQIPLPLVRLLALLFELVGHSDEMSRLIDMHTRPDATTASDGQTQNSIPIRETLLEAMRNSLLTGDVTALRGVLEQQCLAFEKNATLN